MVLHLYAQWRNTLEPPRVREATWVPRALFYCWDTPLDSVSVLEAIPDILYIEHLLGKEIWEPTIHEIYKLDAKKSTGPIIREVWGLDYQNHGEAAILNEDVLFRNKGIFSKCTFQRLGSFPLTCGCQPSGIMPTLLQLSSGRVFWGLCIIPCMK